MNLRTAQKIVKEMDRTPGISAETIRKIGRRYAIEYYDLHSNGEQMVCWSPAEWDAKMKERDRQLDSRSKEQEADKADKHAAAMWAEYKRRLQAYLDADIVLMRALKRREPMDLEPIIKCAEEVNEVEHQLDHYFGVPHDEEHTPDEESELDKERKKVSLLWLAVRGVLAAWERPDPNQYGRGWTHTDFALAYLERVAAGEQS
jgi:hypothetical protein